MHDPWDNIDLEIVKQRAKQLAAPINDSSVAKDSIKFLGFDLMGDTYAIRLSHVETVTRITDIFSVPLTPKHIQGIIRRRGQTIALVNLKRFFHSSSEDIEDMDFAIICKVLGKTFAIQVKEIDGVFDLDRKLIQSTPENFDKNQIPYLSGVTKEGLIILDLESLTSTEGFGTLRLATNV